MLCSIITPTRNTVVNLFKMMASVMSTATHRTEVEFVLRIDDDNKATIDALDNLSSQYPIQKIIGPRRRGYGSMGYFVEECCVIARGQWVWLLDDDCTIIGNGWDEQLAKLAPDKCAAQPEFYWLGASKYVSGSCGVAALCVPNHFWKQLGEQTIPERGSIDAWWRLLLDSNGWPVHLINGVIYNHQREENPDYRKI